MNVSSLPTDHRASLDLTSNLRALDQPARRATPDSEAIVSSEDERPWPASTTFGAFPRKEGAVPGLGGGIWSTQKRGSFKMAEAAQRNAAREARLGAPNATALRPGTTPSPSTTTTSDTGGSNSLPFAIPLQPVPKAGRSLSHSQGQREHLQGLLGQSAADHALPLGLLAEEGDVETDSDYEGSALSQTASQGPISSLQRIQTLPTNYNAHQHYQQHQHHDTLGSDDHPGTMKQDRRLDAAFANMSFADHPHQRQRAQWQSHLGWDDLPNHNESRRHSLADIPTRRGSLDESPPNLISSVFSNRLQRQSPQSPRADQGLLPLHTIHTLNDARRGSEVTPTTMRYNELSPVENFHIPPQYKVPFVALDESDRVDAARQSSLRSPYNPGGSFRPRKLLFIVSFKCSRVDVFYLLEGTGLTVREGDIVIVEADRGQDLGTVQHANVTPEQARNLKRKYSEEQYKWLMMFSRNNAQGNVNPNAQSHGESGGNSSLLANAPPTMQGLPRDNFNNLKPKAIKRLASAHEIKMLAEKEGNEAKAKRACQQKVAHLNLQMEILDAEWQWDFQKLIFYYYADHYINFKDLITDLYRIYKTRIWLSAVNPASFSQHAMGQPPSGLGPGAITGYNQGQGVNSSYTMAYGPDPDPYGAVPPYRIGYDTYTPNYPGIPGVSNSFAPSPSIATESHYPTTEPGTYPTGHHMDYHPFYDSSGRGAHLPTASISTSVDGSGGVALTGAYHQGVQFGVPGFQFPPNPVGPIGGHIGRQSSQWGASPSRGMAGGRHGELPLPIGTRPGSNGNSAQTPTAGDRSQGFGTDLRSPNRYVDSGFGIHMGGGPGPMFGSMTAAMPGGGNGSTVNKQAQVKNYLSKLPDTQHEGVDEGI